MYGGRRKGCSREIMIQRLEMEEDEVQWHDRVKRGQIVGVSWKQLRDWRGITWTFHLRPREMCTPDFARTGRQRRHVSLPLWFNAIIIVVLEYPRGHRTPLPAIPTVFATRSLSMTTHSLKVISQISSFLSFSFSSKKFID